MNTIKRVWETPVISIQEFAPQEYVAACSRISGRGDFYIDFRTPYGYYNDGEQASQGWFSNDYYYDYVPSDFKNPGTYTTYTRHHNSGNQQYYSPGTTYKIQLRREQVFGSWYRYYVYNATS